MRRWGSREINGLGVVEAGEVGRQGVSKNPLLIGCSYYQLRCSTVHHPFLKQQTTNNQQRITNNK